MQLNLWFVLIVIIGLCLIGLTIILRGAYRESKLRRRKASVRKWVQSETVGRAERECRRPTRLTRHALKVALPLIAK